MKKYTFLFSIFMLLFFLSANAQINQALNGTANHSGGGATIYGPQNYNDGVISAYPGLPWGWVSTGGWIEYTWTSPVSFNAVAFYKDDRPMTICDFQYWDGTQYVNFFSYNSTAPAYDSITFPTISTTRLRFDNVSGSSNPNHREIRVWLNSFAPNDAAVTKLDSPTVFCAGTENIVITICNYGNNQLDSVDVNWEFNGVAQPSFTYVGALDTIGGSNPSCVQISLGAQNFPAGSFNTVKAWTSMPNGVADTINNNDTLIAQVGPGLIGTFTLDPNQAASATNYTSFANLETALNTFGLCGPTTINVANGAYNSSLYLDDVPGLSAVNTLTIDGGDSSQTILSHDGTANLATVTLDNCSYVTLSNMGIRATGANSGVGVLITGVADGNQILNNDVRVTTSSTSTAVSNIVFSGSATSATTTSNQPFSNNMIANNNMIGGYYGLRMFSSTTNTAVDNAFMNNRLDSIYYYGVYAGYLDGVEIIGNDIDQTKLGQTNGDGIYLLYTNNGRVNANNIIAEDYGFYWTNSSTATPPLTRYNEVINNMIISNGDFANYLYSIDSVNYWHNSLQTFGSGSPAFYIGMSTTYPMGDWDCRNNIMASNDGPAMDMFTATDTIFNKLDNNVYYTVSGAVLIDIDGTTYPDLPSYQTAQPLLNTASLEGDPQYTSPFDLHIVGAFLNDSGDASVPVAFDIDGDARPMVGAASVDIGADEYNPPSCPPPGNQSVANLASDSATLIWFTNTPGNTIEYEWMPCGTPQGSGTSGSVAADSVNISGLNPASCYQYWIREICGRGDTSIWIGPFSFNTLIQSPQGITCTTGTASIIFSDEFDAVGAWTGDVGTGTTAGQWNFGHSGGTGSANTGPSGGAHSGLNYVYLEGSGGTPPATMVSPAIDLSAASGQAELSFWLHATGSEIGDLDVAVGTSPTGPFTSVFSWSGQLQTAMAQPFQNVGVDLSSYIGQTIYLQFEYTNWVCCASDVAIDLLEVTSCVSCAAPANLNLDSLGSTTAGVSWNTGVAGNTIQYSIAPCGSTIGSGTVNTLVGNSVVFTNLNPATCYEVYIREFCPPSDTSIWVGPIAFNTNIQSPQGVSCTTGNPSVILQEEFDVVGGWTGNVGTGTTAGQWNFGHSGGTGSVNTGPLAAHSGTNYAYVECSGSFGGTATAVSPLISLSGGSGDAELSFWMHLTGADAASFTVGVGTNQSGPFTQVFSWNGQLQTAQANPYQNVGIDLSAYLGQDIYLEFEYSGWQGFGADIAIDLLEITTCVSCASPDSTTVSNITLTDATLNWRDNAGASSWEVSYGPVGGGPGSGVTTVVTSRPLNLTGLTPSTAYEFFVRAICAPGDTSSWSQGEGFNTANGVPYLQDFESWQTNATGLINEAGWYTNGTPTPHWEVSTLTTSSGTGPVVDHTTGTSSGQFVHLECSGGGLGDTDTLWSAPIYFSPSQNSVTLEYWYHMHGGSMGTLEVYVDTNGVLSPVISTFTGQQHPAQTDPWLSATANLNGYADKSVQLVFVGIRGNGFASDMAIDDVELFVPAANDLGVTDILSPTSDCGLTNDTVEIEITNFGSAPQSNVPVRYSINNAPPVQETVAGPIPAGGTVTYQFNALANLSTIGSYIVNTSTNLVGDAIPANNNLAITVENVPTINPSTVYYTQGFEYGPGGWTSGGQNSTWALGAPAGIVINSAANGSQAWVTNLNGDYVSDEDSWLMSPCIDLSSATNPVIEASIWYDIESQWDAAIFEASIDGGVSWFRVGFTGDTVNWYNDTSDVLVTNSIYITGDAWTGDGTGVPIVSGSNGWLRASHDLFGLAGQSNVRLRFRFVSDAFTVAEGFAVDSVMIYDNLNVGIENAKAKVSEFSLSPNPSNGLFNLKMTTDQAEQMQLTVRDIDGKLVYEEWLNVNGNFNKAMDLSNLAKGVYFLQLQNENATKVEKLVIQ